MEEQNRNGGVDRGLGKWFIALSQVVFLIVIVGGVVRITGSGLSIPEWPLINGSLMPPTSEQDWEAVYKTYHREIEGVEVPGIIHEARPGVIPFGEFRTMFSIEYFHRFLVASFGLLFLFVMIKVMRNREARARYGMVTCFALCLLLTQAMLGGLVVKTDLEAVLVAIHLGVAFFFFALLFWIGLSILYPPSENLNGHNRRFYRLTVAATVLVFIQILTGGLMAGTQAGFHLNTWPLIGDYLIPPGSLLWSPSYDGFANIMYNKLLQQFIHRWWAFAAAGMVFYLVVAAMRFTVPSRARFGMRALSALIVLQIILGIFTLLFQVPPHMAITHLAVGFLVFEVLVLLGYELRNHEVVPV
ncbi:MAG: heme A synthase [Candidatus Glassbacteria bacterium]|nr:heme A synthase [Candidatus Glassbacteria bacterium]